MMSNEFHDPTSFFTAKTLPQFGHLCSISFNELIKNGIKQSGGKRQRIRTISQVPKPTVRFICVMIGLRH
jgi:hypothetical protein